MSRKKPLALFERYQAGKDSLRDSARQALREAKASGTPAYYTDRTWPEGIVREMPDGSRPLVKLENGHETVVEELPPAQRDGEI